MQADPRRGGAGLDVELLEDAGDVVLGSAGAYADDAGDLAIAFAFSDPVEDFGFAGREAEGTVDGGTGWGGIRLHRCDEGAVAKVGRMGGDAHGGSRAREGLRGGRWANAEWRLQVEGSRVAGGRKRPTLNLEGRSSNRHLRRRARRNAGRRRRGAETSNAQRPTSNVQLGGGAHSITMVMLYWISLLAPARSMTMFQSPVSGTVMRAGKCLNVPP